MSPISSAATSKTRRKDSQEFSNQRSVIRAKSSKRPVTDYRYLFPDWGP